MISEDLDHYKQVSKIYRGGADRLEQINFSKLIINGKWHFFPIERKKIQCLTYNDLLFLTEEKPSVANGFP